MLVYVQNPLPNILYEITSWVTNPHNNIPGTWTQQMGYPVLSVEAETTQDTSQTILKISQKKFSGDGSEDAKNSLWAVPISLVTSKVCFWALFLFMSATPPEPRPQFVSSVNPFYEAVTRVAQTLHRWKIFISFDNSW